jgi:type IV pilus assembly protein PilM
MPVLALDIGSYSLKFISAEAGKKPTIARVVEVPNTLGFVIPSDDAQAQKLGELINTVINDHKLPRTGLRLSLPEALVSTKVITIPSLTDAELASAIDWQAEQYIPIPKEEVALQYQVLFRPAKDEKNQMMRVLLVGTRKAIVEKYANLFINIGTEPIILETQLFSVIRSLDLTNTDPTTMIVNFGASTTDLAVVDQGELQFVASNQIGGKVFTKALEQSLSLDAEQAEQYKRQYGLDQSQFEGKVSQALQGITNSFVAELSKSIKYYQSQNPTNPLKRIVLAGGASQLPGLTQYLTAQLTTEVLLADPFYAVKGEAPATNRQAFAVTMGLLMREG